MAVSQASDSPLPEALARKLPGIIAQGVSTLMAKDATGLASRMALIAFLIRVISAAIAFVSQIILARMMGEHEYGIFVFVWVLVILIGNLSCLGFHSAQIRFLPEFETNRDFDRIRGLTTTARIFALISSSVVAALGFAALTFFGSAIESYYVMPLFIGLFILPMIALGDTMEGTARANSWAVVALSPTYIIRPMLILVFMVGAVWLGEPQTAETAMWAGLAATYVTSVGQFFNIDWRMKRQFSEGPRHTEFGLWFKVAIPIFFIEGFGFLLTNSDTVVTGLFLPPGEVGIYFAASKTIAFVQFVMFSVKAASAPRFSALQAEGDSHALGQFALKTARWTFWPVLVVGLVALAFGNFLLSMFGPGFTAGYSVMVILFFGVLGRATVGPAESLLVMAGEQSLCVKVYAAALAANIGLNVVLLPLYGIEGAALAAGGAMLIEAMLLHIAVRYRLSITLFAFARTPAAPVLMKDAS